MKVRAIGIAILTVAGLLGCSGSGDVDIGDDTPENLGSELKDYAGRWEGYAEAHQFRDGSDRVRLTLDSEGNGWLELGNDAAPLPAPSIDEYPPGYSDTGPTASSPGLLLGYEHVIRGAMVSTSRLKLETSVPVELAGWCGLFTPVMIHPQTYSCLPNTGFQRDPETAKCYEGGTVRGAEIACSKIVCTSSCYCDATSCLFSQWEPIQLDGALDRSGKTLTGTIVLGDSVTIRLTRAN